MASGFNTNNKHIQVYHNTNHVLVKREAKSKIKTKKDGDGNIHCYGC